MPLVMNAAKLARADFLGPRNSAAAPARAFSSARLMPTRFQREAERRFWCR